MSTRAVGQNLGNSIHIRGDIDVTNLVCVPCKKKHGGAATCYAHAIVDGKGICVFCEDGEPCMHEQRQAKAAKNLQIVKTNLTPGSGTVPREAHNLETSGSTPVRATSYKVAAPPQQSPVQLLADRLRADGLPEADIHAALVAQGYKARDINKVLPQPQVEPKEKTMNTAVRPNGHAPVAPVQVKMCGREGCGKKLQDRNESGFCAAHFGDSRVKARGGTPGRVCSTPGCGQSLRSDNKSGVCKPCSKGETKASRRGTKRAKHETVASPVPSINPPTEMLQLQVSESQLDRFLGTVDWNGVVSKLPADMKLTLANHYFAAGLDQAESKAQAAAA